MSETVQLQAGSERLHVRTWGEPTAAQVVVLVHGYPDTHALWLKIAEDLARDHYVVAYDVRGAGASSVPRSSKDYRLDAFVEDLSAVLARFSPERPVHLVGHDWGSIHSWESVTTPHLKGRIASFTSISGPSLDHASHWLRKRALSPSFSGSRQLVLQLLRSWYVFAFHIPGASLVWKLGLARMWPRLLARLEGARVEPSLTRAQDASNGIAMYRANFLWRIMLPRKRVAHAPVQVIVPMKDLYVSPALSEDLSAWVPRLVRREVPDAGHWLPLTHPGLVARYVREFVGSLAESAG